MSFWEKVYEPKENEELKLLVERGLKLKELGLNE